MCSFPFRPVYTPASSVLGERIYLSHIDVSSIVICNSYLGFAIFSVFLYWVWRKFGS